jgi:acetyl-CoA C-acetyltransferase
LDTFLAAMHANTPVIVGVGQWLGREEDPRNALEPLASLETAARLAADDAGGGERLLEQIDTCGLVEIFGWKPQNGPQLLGQALGASPRRHLETVTGGETGLVLINHVAEQIARGETRVGLVAGGNNMQTLFNARAGNVWLEWNAGGEGKPTPLGEARWGSSDLEQAYGMGIPLHVYPMFDNALRAARGTDPKTHLRNLGRLMSRFSEVAAKNPYAWFPTFRSAEELSTVTPQNRLIAWPYPKYLNAVMTTDQAAAVLITSVEAARELGIPEERWVWWRGGAWIQETAWFPSERRDFHSSEGLRAAVQGALAQAGLELDALAQLDFYSCFPSAVQMACAMLDLAWDDPRDLTVTGGLPYAGGPANAYTLNAAAAMVEQLRQRRGDSGLLTGLGWYFTKHAATVLASAPAEPGAGEPAPEPVLPPAVPVAAQAEGPARVETYTVLFERDGTPKRGIVIGRLEGGERFLAKTPNDRATLESLVEHEGVGLPGRVQHANDRNVFTPS